MIEMTPLSQTKPIKIQKKTPTLYILNKSSISSGQIVLEITSNRTRIAIEQLTGLQSRDNPSTFKSLDGIGFISSSKHAVSFLAYDAYFMGGSFRGT